MNQLGAMHSDSWARDPKHLLFTLSRYKFVSKLLQGKHSVLEVGCADGFASRVVRQAVGILTAVDIKVHPCEQSEKWPIIFKDWNILTGPLPGFDAVYCLDVFEHIAEEDTLLQNLRACAPVCVIGAPSIESQKYASQLSKEGHVNCVTGEYLRGAMARHWKHVFMFGMNDEVVHTGYLPMAHYLFGVGVE